MTYSTASSTQPTQTLYQPLLKPTSIRLIELLGADDPSEPIACRVRHADLDDRPEYEAVSYVWGDANNPVAISCNGIPLRIAPNSAKALLRFRPPSKQLDPRVLWADALCINQDDIEEKQNQVPLMGRIYSEATCVLIWLGSVFTGRPRGEQESRLALECIQTLLHQIGTRVSEFLQWQPEYENLDGGVAGTWMPNLIQNDEALTRHFGIPRSDDPSYSAIRRILRSTRFSTAWTFQESFLAKRRTFYLDDVIIPGYKLGHVVSILSCLLYRTGNNAYWNRDEGSVQGMTEGCDLWKSYKQARLTDPSIARRGTGCTKEHDRIYSLIGAAEDAGSIIVDYSQPFAEVFAQATRQHIIHHGSLDTLGEAVIFIAPGSSVVPSWVPDWRVEANYRWCTDLDKKLYSCAGTSWTCVTPSPNPLHLILCGFKFTRVTAKEIDCSPTLEDWCRHWILAGNDFRYLYTDEGLQTVIFRARCADLVAHNDVFTHLRKRMGSDKTMNLESLAVQRGPIYNAILARTAPYREKSQFIATTERHLGYAPRSVQVGDIICLMLGGEVPLVLRQDPMDNRYLFVGECYLHGFMDGEGLVEIRKRMDSEYDGLDTSWLNRLHEEPLPSAMTPAEFCIK